MPDARSGGRHAPFEPAEETQEWRDELLPRAVDDALSVVGGRYHAIVVDEGQYFARDWLDSLYLMLTDAEQALYREDVVASLGLPEYAVETNCRNTGPIHRLAARYAKGLESASVLREEGREPELVPAAASRETLEALRKVLHRLTVDKGLAPWQIAVLTGRSLAKSDVWRQRVFGNQVLWNGSCDVAGHSLGLSADRAPDQPTDTIL